MATKLSLRILITGFACSLIFITGCGSSNNPGNSSSTSTNITSRGVITGFGSIFVNGVEYHTGNSQFTIDDNPGTEGDLKLGMVVTVTGARSDDSTGEASSIIFDNELQGPVANLVTGADGLSKSFTLFGISVLVDSVSTSFSDFSFDTLANDDLVEVSGFYDANQVLIASYIERKNAFSAGVSEVELKGVVSNTSTNSFAIGSITVNYDSSGINTDLSRVNSAISDGLLVEVKGSFDGSATISATRIALEDHGFDDNMGHASNEGYITDYVDDSNFMLAGTAVDASSASFTPAGLTLGNGVKVEAEGSVVNGVMQASKISARGGDQVLIEASIAAVDSTNNTLSLDLINGTITVYSDIRTRMEDKTKVLDRLSLSDLANGDFVEARGVLDASNRIILTQLRRNDSDDIILQGKVDAIDAGNSLSILGVTIFSNSATEYKDRNNVSISAVDFYNSVAVGALVKIKDRKPADGSADEMEFEN